MRRLCPPLHPEQARALHMRLTADALRRLAAPPPCPVRLYTAPSAHHPLFRALSRRYRVPLRRQDGSTLGQRLHRGLSQALGGAEAAVAVGTDLPDLAGEDVCRALEALEQGREAVFQPAADGGYGLVGLSRPRPELFRGIPWGTGEVMTATRQRCREHGLDWAELPVAWDLDRPEDLERLPVRLRLPHP